MKNLGENLLCIPSVYSDEGGFGAVVFRYRAGGDQPGLTESYDPNRFASVRYAGDMLEFFSLPQMIVQPGQTRDIDMQFDGKFDLQAKPADASLRLIVFNCLQGSGDPSGAIKDLRTEVTYH